MIEQQPSRLGGLVHRSYIPRHPRSTRLGISLIANALRSYVHLSTDSRKHLHWAASLSICTGNNLAGAISEVHRLRWQLHSSTPTSIHRSGIYLAGELFISGSIASCTIDSNCTRLSISQHLYTVDARYLMHIFPAAGTFTPYSSAGTAFNWVDILGSIE